MKARIEGVYLGLYLSTWKPFDSFEVEIEDCLPDWENFGCMGTACNSDQLYRYQDYWENHIIPHQITIRLIP